MNNITKECVIKAASEKGIRIIEAISMMQAVAAKNGDSALLDRLCEIKSEILFG